MQAGKRDLKYVIFSCYNTTSIIQSFISNSLNTILFDLIALHVFGKAKRLNMQVFRKNTLRIYSRKLSSA